MNIISVPQKSKIRTAMVWLLSGLMASATPMQVTMAQSSAKACDIPIPAAVQKILKDLGETPTQASNNIVVRHGTHKLQKITPKLDFSTDTSDIEIATARVFPEPLTPLSTASVSGENVALAKVLVAFKERKDHEDVSDLTKFIEAFPNSRWRASLELNLGLNRFEYGYLSDALTFWQSAWESAKAETGNSQKLAADRAIGELVLLEARLGKTDILQKHLADVEGRVLLGSMEEKVRSAREGLWKMQHRPEYAFKCGPYAINNILNLGKKTNGRDPIIEKAASTSKGTNLKQCKDWADQVGLHYQIAKRTKDAPIIVPSVMHWGVGHFCAVTALHQGRYQIKDPTFDINGNLWISDKAINSQSDGYFLIPEGPLPRGWQNVSDDEAQIVWGRGAATGTYNAMPITAPTPWGTGYQWGSDPRYLWGWTGYNGGDDSGGGPGGPGIPPTYVSTPPNNSGGGGSCSRVPGAAPPAGMVAANAQTMNATLTLSDVPIGYAPPIGPAMSFFLRYTYLVANQPSNFNFPNFGQDWSLNWISYLTVDASKNVTVSIPGGGFEQYPFVIPDNVTNPYPSALTSQAQLTVADNGVYHRQLPDGSVMVYDQPDGTGRIFMTRVIDPRGNSAAIQYDSNFRITSITDAINQATVFTYASNIVGNVGYYKITQISDPFSRVATFAYDSSTTFLTSITDVVGNVSSFLVDNSNSFISALTTGYGTSSFFQYTPAGGVAPARGLRFTFSDGTSSVLENFLDETKSSYFWDREATTLYPSDPENRIYTHCKTTKFLIDASNGLESPVINYVKPPLESQITYVTEGETGSNYVGTSNNPIQISRLMDDGSTQNYFYEYNKFGKVTKSIDPVGRTFSYLYAANNVDLLEVRQTRSGNNDLLGKLVFNNNQHVPNLYIDGSGQRTQFVYNSFGELTQTTDANSGVWTRSYDSSGYLTQTEGPLSGNKDVHNFSYDSFGRLQTSADSEGYTVTFAYDALNRPTLTTYPDGTTEQTVWNKLDAILTKDRIGRWTQDSYNSMQQMSYEIDPLGRKTQYAWCNCGSLAKLTDPAGNVTTWHHDLEGRKIQKVYQDSTTIDYVYENNTSRLKSMTDALGQTTNYSYNIDNTLAQKSYTNAVNATSSVNYTFDANYNRLSTIQNGWGTYTYSYNPYITDPYASPTTGGGRLASVTNNVIPNSAVTYTFDALGRTTNRSIDGANNSVTWVYDAMSRVTSEANALGTFGYSYVDDQSGNSRGSARLSSISYPNSQVTNFGWYDNQGDQRLQQISNLKSDGTALSQFSYGYNPAGEITQWQQQQNGSNQNGQYSYDLAGQLKSVQNGSTNLPPAYSNQNYYSYDSASNRTASQRSSFTQVKIGGAISVGDGLTLTVTDSGLSTPESVLYTVQSGDTLASVSAQLAAAITANSNLQTLGVNAISDGANIFIKSVSANITTYSQSTTGGATETIKIGTGANTVELVAIGGSKTTGDTIQIVVHDTGLPGGVESVSYNVLAGDTLNSIASGLSSAINADANLSALGVTSTVSGQVLRLTSTSSNTTTYTQTLSTNATETVVFRLSPNGACNVMLAGTKTTADILTLVVYDAALSGGSKAVSYNVLAGDTISSIAANLAAAINADSSLQAINVSASASGPIVTVNSVSVNSTSYRGTASAGATETITVGINTNGTQTASIGGTATAGDTVSIVINDDGLAGGTSTKTYTVISGNTSANIASGLASAINGDSALSAVGITASGVSSVLNLKSQSVNATTYSSSLSGGASETVFLAPNVGVTQFAYNNVNELTSFAPGGQTCFGGFTNKALKSATINSNPAKLTYGENFEDTTHMSAGINAVSVVVTDGSNTTKTNGYAMSVNSGSTTNLTFDLNGNMTSDGTNSYTWDAENRMIKITYPGTNNFSTFVYDGLSRNVSIVETTAGSVTSTKQLVWANDAKRPFQFCEERDISGALTKKFFDRGQMNSTTKYFYSLDHLGSIREMSDNSGVFAAQYSFDPFGRLSKLSEVVASDFAYVGYYLLSRSGLNLTLFRAYTTQLGRWINRDPIGEAAGPNLYSYVVNCPIDTSDLSGLRPSTTTPIPCNCVQDQSGNPCSYDYRFGPAVNNCAIITRGTTSPTGVPTIYTTIIGYTASGVRMRAESQPNGTCIWVVNNGR
ncbi:MAG: hypothetical protein JST89_09385 [Cyanobacteria bacterium SZAS-4]|nr:hypothetical protein [Cyanobacteria bacterium SZAS-4]